MNKNISITGKFEVVDGKNSKSQILSPVWIEGGRRESRIELAKNKLS